MMPRNTLLRTCALLCVALFLTGPIAAQQAQQRQKATMRLLLPHPNAQVTVNGKVMTAQTGSTRTFETPDLDVGGNYSYTVVVNWEPNNYTKITRTREIAVKPGQTVEADLSKLDEKQPDKVVIRYVPTPQEVVDAMLQLGSVGKNDIVYDLGCGDGRIVITAVKKFGAQRGVGVDIDPERIKDSKANAKQDMVEDKVEFRMEDVLQMKDLSTATVVTLYMGRELNIRMEPILKKLLKPGSRVVSHRFLMSDAWKPLKSITVTDSRGEKYHLHLWVIGEGDAGK
jgi:uncharacterized protein (TIGR03000 family)